MIKKIKKKKSKKIKTKEKIYEKNEKYKGDNGIIKIGDYVNYTPDTATNIDETLNHLSEYSGYEGQQQLEQEELKWRVLDVVDGRVRLISEKTTTSKIALRGWNGYNNAVYLIDEACKTLYNNTKYANNVQNLKIEDIQNVTTAKYTEGDPFYGKTFSSSKTKNYPSIFSQEEGQVVDGKEGTLGLSKQDKLIKQTEINTAKTWNVKSTCWYYDFKKEEFIEPVYLNLFFKYKNEKNEEEDYPVYWLSSRCVYAYYDQTKNDDSIQFDVRIVTGSWNELSSHTFVYANTENTILDRGMLSFRPVVTLNSNIQLKSGDGTQSTPYEIGL